jgi:hypothetical protein
MAAMPMAQELERPPPSLITMYERVPIDAARCMINECCDLIPVAAAVIKQRRQLRAICVVAAAVGQMWSPKRRGDHLV